LKVIESNNSGNNNKDDDNDDTEQKQTTPSPTLIWKEETVIPATLQDLPPRCIPLKIEPETTTSYDIGCQIAMLTQTAYQDWWRMNPPILISAPRPIGPFYPLSGACCYCGGPWQAKDGRTCRYHPSPGMYFPCYHVLFLLSV
jgi:hypothetical protein